MERKKEDNFCYFTKHSIAHVDYRDVHLLNRFINQHGKIVPRRWSKLCSKYQRSVKKAISRARYMALMPYVKQ